MRTNIARKVTTGFLTFVLTTGAGVGLAATASAAPTTGGTVATNHKTTTMRVVSPDGWAAVRKGPGVSYKRVGKLSEGTRVTVYETKGGWSRIGNCKWVASWLLKPVNHHKPSKPGTCKDTCPSTPAPAPTQICRVYVGMFSSKNDAECRAKELGGDAFVVALGNGEWTVQVGSFDVKANADTLAAKFKHARVVCTNS